MRKLFESVITYEDHHVLRPKSFLGVSQSSPLRIPTLNDLQGLVTEQPIASLIKRGLSQISPS